MMDTAEVPMGRPVRLASLSFAQDRYLQGIPLEELVNRVEAEAARGCDLIALPETCRGQHEQSMETIDGPTVQALSRLAQRHATHIVCPIDRLEGAARLNTAVLIGRDGRLIGHYDKLYPYWEEYKHPLPVTPGQSVPVFETDFGRVGLAICFDANFPDVWQRLADGDAELVVWSSAYSAGTQLQAHALNHHYHILTSTWVSECALYDISGEVLLHDRSAAEQVSRIQIDLERRLYHENYNMEKRDQLLANHPGEVRQEKYYQREAWFMLRPARAGVSVRQLAESYGLEELRDYKRRSWRQISTLRAKALHERALKE